MLELMVVVGILGMLGMVARTQFAGSSVRARRAEAMVTLESVQAAQFAYYAAHNEFAPDFTALSFRPEGAEVTAEGGLTGPEYRFTMSRPWGKTSWMCTASAQLDEDAFKDVLVSYERL